MAVSNTPAHGPKGADPVDTATGFETNAPNPDLIVYNPSGPDVVWHRNFVSLQSLLRERSPGFSNGWVHGYDVRMETWPAEAGQSWPDVTLMFPSGAQVALTPTMASGVPTGAFSRPSGTPYIVTGTPDTTNNKWTNIYVTWADGTKWRFELQERHERDVYVLGSLYNRTGQSISFNWDTGRRLTYIEADDAYDTVLLTLTYGTDGLLQKVTDVDGRSVWYTFAVPANSAQTLPVANTPLTVKCLTGVSQIGASGGAEPAKQWIYGYAGFYDRPLLWTTSVPDPDGSGTIGATFYYDALGRVSRVRDGNLNNTRFFYNVAGETKVRYTNSADATLYDWYQKFDSLGRSTGKRDSNGDESFIQYSDPDNPYSPTKITDEEGRETAFTYDGYGNLRTTLTPRGVKTTYTYTYTSWTMGRLTSIQESINSGAVTKPATTLAYAEPSGLVTSVTRPLPIGINTITTYYQYNSFGDLTRITAPSRLTGSIYTVFNYTTDGVYSQAQKRGQPVTVSLASTLNGSGVPTGTFQTWHLRYDTRGNVNQVTDTLGRQTDATYNLADDVTKIELPPTGQTGPNRGSITNVFQYPGGPQSSTEVRDEGASGGSLIRDVDYTFGHEGEVLTVTGSAEPVTYTYDPAYRIKTLTDGNTGGTTTYTYDAANNLTKESMPRAGEAGKPAAFDTISYTHDGTGAVLSRTDGRGLVINFDYSDPDGLLTAVTYPADTTQNVAFTFDDWGRPATRTDAAGKLTYTFTPADYLQVLGTQYKNPTTGALLVSRNITYSYKPDGARAAMNVNGNYFTPTYDALNRLVGMEDPQGLDTTWSYNLDNTLDTQTLPGGATTEYDYNAAGQLISLINKKAAGVLISQFGHQTDATKKLAYDGAGNLLKVTANLPAEAALTGVTNFTYDTKNQLTQEQSVRGGAGAYTHNFVYNAAGNATTFKSAAGRTFNAANQQTNTGYVYDGNGNPTTYGGATLAYDILDNLTQYNASGGGLVFKAGYRSDGLRAWKEDSAGVRTFFIYDGINVVGEFNVGAAMSAWQMWGPTGLVARRKMLVNNNPGWTAAATSYYEYDTRGNLVHQLSTTGTVDEDYGHTAYGERVAEGTGVSFGRSDGPVGYGGQFGYQTDAETGLILCGFRYYDPKNGRWLTRDPIGYAGGVNVYAYVGNNPTNHIDPPGLFWPLVVAAAGASFAGWGNVGAQTYATWNQPGPWIQKMDGGDIAIASSVGAASGVASPYMPGIGGAMVLGGISNGFQYSWTQASHGQPMFDQGFGYSCALGIASGYVAGAFTPPQGTPYNLKGYHLSAVEKAARNRINNNMYIPQVFSPRNLRLAAGSAIVSNAPTSPPAPAPSRKRSISGNRGR